MHAGRPRADLDLAVLRRLVASGISHTQTAHRLGISLTTLRRRIDEDDDVGRAFRTGLADLLAATPVEAPAAAKGTVLALNLQRCLAADLKTIARERGKTRHAVIVEALSAFVATHQEQPACP